MVIDEMTGVQDYYSELPPDLAHEGGGDRFVIWTYTRTGMVGSCIDLLDLLTRIKESKPELLSQVGLSKTTE